MNQSDWFSIEDDQLFQNSDLSQQNKVQTEIEKIVSKYEKIVLQQNLIKFIVVVSKNEDAQKQINEKSRIKIRCEEKDEKGNILNPTQNLNILKICLSSTIPLIKGFRLALLSMKEGEKAWFKISGDLLEKPDNIENFVKDQVKYYLITVEEVTQPQQQLDVTNVEKYFINHIQSISKQKTFNFTITIFIVVQFNQKNSNKKEINYIRMVIMQELHQDIQEELILLKSGLST